MAHTVVAPREASVRRELGPFDRGAERRPEPFHPDRDIDPAVGGSEGLERHDVRMGAPLAPRLLARDEEHAEPRRVGEERAVQERHIHALPFARALAVQQRGEDAEAG